MSDQFLRRDSGFSKEEEDRLFNTPPTTARKQSQAISNPESLLERFKGPAGDKYNLTAEFKTPKAPINGPSET